MTIRIPTETSNAFTPPAPDWVRQAATAPVTIAASSAYDDAVATAKAAARANIEAIRAFRDASIQTRDGYVPARGTSTDEWRVLQAAQADAVPAERLADSAARRAWHTYADALADDPGAEAAVESAYAQRHQEAQDAVAAAIAAIESFMEPLWLAPRKPYQTTTEVRGLLRDMRDTLAPLPEWQTVRSPEAQALVEEMRR